MTGPGSAENPDALRRADEAARRLAVSEFTVPVALEAGAGTGKTRALVSRLATWLLGPGWNLAEQELVGEGRSPLRPPDPLDIASRAAEGAVAITFTEAAAAEMARRLGALLLEVAAGRDSRDLTPLPELLVGVDLAPRARAHSASISRVRISTIHGFCHGLLAEHPFDARLHPAIEVDAEGERLASAAREALVGHLRSRDEAVLELIAAGVDPVEIHAAIVALAGAGARRADLAAPRYTDAECDALLAALAAAVRRFLARLEPVVAAAKRAKRAGSTARALHQLVAAAVEGTLGARDRLARLSESLPGLAAEWSTAFEAWERGELNKSEADFLGLDRDAYLEAAREVGDQIEFLERADPSAFERGRRALAPLLEATRARLRRSGTLTFDDLLDEAVSLLRDNGALRRRIRRSIRQLLVDEFQDTDRRQCELLRQLVLVDAEGEHPGLFLVGDPKQSIYAWRNADLAAYESFLGELAAAGGAAGRLAVNFRSTPPILDEVARSVAPAMVYEERVQPAFERLLASPANAAAPDFAVAGRGPVEFWLSWDAEAVAAGEAPRAGRAAEIEAAAIAADIAELALRHGAPWKEFAILLRTRGHLDIYLEALRRAGLPYAVQNDRSYYRRREVIDVLSLVRFVLDPGDDLARVAALRSPFVGVPDAAWLPLESAGLSKALRELDGDDPSRLREIAELVASAAVSAASGAPNLSGVPGLAELADWPAALLAAVENTARLRAEWRTLPVSVWLERLRTRFLVEPIAAARFLGRFGLANVERLFDELESAFAESADPLAALATLRRAVEEDVEAAEARPPEAEVDAVSVLTIHAAKGLEFAHVYVAQAHKEPPAKGARAAAALLRAIPGAPAELELFGAPSPGWRAVRAAFERARQAETVRLLYVALTRARTRLVVCGLWSPEAGKLPPARSFLALLAARRPEDLAPLFEPGEVPRIADRALWRRLDRIVSPPRPAAASDAFAAVHKSISIEDRERAARRQARPRFESASTLAGAGLEETVAELLSAGDERESGDARAPGRIAAAGEIARARGIALHRALELADGPTDAGSAESAARAAYLAARPAAGATEVSALERDLGALRGSALWRRRMSLGPSVLARELPLAIAAFPELEGDFGPTDGYVGTLDLLYRDPETGETVVADFKSDPLDGGDLEAEIAAKAARYAPQLALYGRAVERGLALQRPPRLELWLLAADRIEVVAPPGAAAR